MYLMLSLVGSVSVVGGRVALLGACDEGEPGVEAFSPALFSSLRTSLMRWNLFEGFDE